MAYLAIAILLLAAAVAEWGHSRLAEERALREYRHRQRYWRWHDDVVRRARARK